MQKYILPLRITLAAVLLHSFAFVDVRFPQQTKTPTVKCTAGDASDFRNRFLEMAYTTTLQRRRLIRSITTPTRRISRASSMPSETLRREVDQYLS